MHYNQIISMGILIIPCRKRKKERKIKQPSKIPQKNKIKSKFNTLNYLKP